MLKTSNLMSRAAPALAAAAFCFWAAAVATPAQAQTKSLCGFDPAKFSFAGDAKTQARCLLRPVRMAGILDPKPLPVLPAHLDAVVGTKMAIAAATIRKHLAAVGLTEANVGGSLDAPLSRANDNDKKAPMARYFVIHDTSSPWFGDKPFPADTDPAVNNLKVYSIKRAAHLFSNRLPLSPQSIYAAHTLDTPWRATQLEIKSGVRTKGLFIHVENVQPRRRNPKSKNPKNDQFAPQPGFTDAQYEKLALLYVIASRRAGEWMIPVFHVAMDAGGFGDHDDPQNFELPKFDAAIGKLIAGLK